MSDIRMIAGLGNPGARYEVTRHNAGFMVVDAVEQKTGAGWRNWSGVADVARTQDGVLLLKPQTFMNHSGRAVRRAADYFKVDPGEILVVFDDFSIPLGTMRLRRAGSAGGHNGITSIIGHLGTSDFPRLRIGIGPLPPRISSPDFVLGAFSPDECSTLGRVVEHAVTVIEEMIHAGWERAAQAVSRGVQDSI